MAIIAMHITHLDFEYRLTAVNCTNLMMRDACRHLSNHYRIRSRVLYGI